MSCPLKIRKTFLCFSGENSEDDGAMEDEDELAFGEGERIPNVACLFCTSSASTVEENLKHMSSYHSFFVPDLEYLVDVEGD